MSESNKERPILIIHDDKFKDQQWTIAKDNAVVGRGEECDIVLPERQVSRQHVRIFKEDDAYYVEDLESRNGTWVNGQQLKGSRRLYDGDKIDLALAVHLEFIGSGATAPLASPTDALVRAKPRPAGGGAGESSSTMVTVARKVDPRVAPRDGFERVTVKVSSLSSVLSFAMSTVMVSPFLKLRM